MSNLKLSDLLPDTIKFFPDAEKDFLCLDKGRQIKVVKALQKIAVAPDQLGKPLENHVGRPLAGFRSIYVDNKAVRIIWKVAESGDIHVAIVAGIAERKGLFDYELTAKRRQEVESFIARIFAELLKKD